MRRAIDLSSNAGAAAEAIRASGVDVVIRYYTKYSGGKRLKRDEAMKLAAAGLQIAVVYQDYNDTVGRFSASEGDQQAVDALDIAKNNIRQPQGSAIYFAVDFDASSSDLQSAIIPYFRAIKERFAAAGTSYRIGAYGSGLTLKTLLDEGLIEYAWLSMSTGHRGHAQFKASRRWHILQTRADQLFGLHIDHDELNDDYPNIGEFVPEALAVGSAPMGAPVSQAGVAHAVLARDGLRLRGGPGLDFPPIRTLPYSTIVYALTRSDEWTLLDLEGDGKADGYVHGSFLQQLVS